jgi:hypothetical protein
MPIGAALTWDDDHRSGEGTYLVARIRGRKRKGPRWPLPFRGRAHGATIRRHLIAVAARISQHGRGDITPHLPDG